MLAGYAELHKHQIRRAEHCTGACSCKPRCPVSTNMLMPIWSAFVKHNKTQAATRTDQCLNVCHIDELLRCVMCQIVIHCAPSQEDVLTGASCGTLDIGLRRYAHHLRFVGCSRKGSRNPFIEKTETRHQHVIRCQFKHTTVIYNRDRDIL